MDELFGKSLARSWSEQALQWAPGARRKFLAGTILYSMGALLQSAHNLGRFPLVRAGEVAGILISAGLAVQIWGIVARYHDSGAPNDGVRAVNAKH
jgi:hypothetical protein